MKIFNKLMILMGLLPVFLACNDKDDTPALTSEDSVYYFVNEIMHSWYLWYKDVPDIDYLKFDYPQKLLDALKNPLDHWSFIDNAEKVSSLFEEGEYFGFGFYIRFNEYGDLYIPVIYNNSTAYQLGIRKGYRVASINGIDPLDYNDYDSFFDDSPLSLTFDLYDDVNTIHTYMLSKETVIQNAVFYKDIISEAGKNVGYIVYDSFLGYSLPELEETFEYFALNNVDELIVDLRYNGGGYVTIAQDMAEMIAPANSVGKELYTIEHNDRIGQAIDTTVYFEQHDLNLDLDRVFFITTGNSASASELVINCLEPYMDVILAGAPTHGKPVGMYGLDFNEWVMYPVTNKIVNAEGYGDFFDGIAVDHETGEGLDKAWGDPDDPPLNAILTYIHSGTFAMPEHTEFKSAYNQLPMASQGKKKILILDR